jgi:hypothetical protein
MWSAGIANGSEQDDKLGRIVAVACHRDVQEQEEA